MGNCYGHAHDHRILLSSLIVLLTPVWAALNAACIMNLYCEADRPYLSAEINWGFAVRVQANYVEGIACVCILANPLTVKPADSSSAHTHTHTHTHTWLYTVNWPASVLACTAHSLQNRPKRHSSHTCSALTHPTIVCVRPLATSYYCLNEDQLSHILLLSANPTRASHSSHTCTALTHPTIYY
jgi:hypothetical protein